MTQGNVTQNWWVQTTLWENIYDIAMWPFWSNLKVEMFTSNWVPVIRWWNLLNDFVSWDFVYVSENKADSLKRSIAIRQNLTDEWKERWIENQIDYAILTAEISKATFGMTPSEYKKHKNLKKENLRDYMTDLELIFNMLWEKVTTEIFKKEKPDIFLKNKKVANRWWSVAGKARKDTEKELWRSVVSDGNYLNEWESQKRLKNKKSE